MVSALNGHTPKRRAKRVSLADRIKKGGEETKQVLAELDAEDAAKSAHTSWTEAAIKVGFQRGLTIGRDEGRQQGKNEAQPRPSENLVEVIEMFRALHDGREIECISSADLCIYIDNYGDAVDEAAAICAVMPIVKRVMERKD